MNFALMEQALERIEREPKKWCQDFWAYTDLCGTKYCFAGFVVHIAYLEAVPYGIAGELDSCVIDGKVYSYYRTAKELLGLTPNQAGMLFSSINSLKDIKRYIRIWKEEHEQRSRQFSDSESSESS